MEQANPMRRVKISKVVINIGSGGEEKQNEAAKKLIGLITGRKPAEAFSKKRLPAFKITRGQRIGAYVTLRGEEIGGLLPKLFDAVDNRVKSSSVTDNSLSFGIKEYIDIRGVKYDPAIGMLGMNVNLSFRRAGSRVLERKRLSAIVPRRHAVVSPDEIKDYVKREFKVEVVEG